MSRLSIDKQDEILLLYIKKIRSVINLGNKGT